MSNIRHVVVVRKDLNMPVGLVAAQVAHISDQFMRSRLIVKEGDTPIFTKTEMEWISAPYLSVLAVNCAEDLQDILIHARSEDLPIYEWHDTIPSPTFPDKAIKVRIGISIGPDDFDKIKVVTGALSLY